jgi:hypothetical protein
MPTLRLVQEAIDPSGTHRVAVELQEDGSRWSATAKVHLGVASDLMPPSGSIPR